MEKKEDDDDDDLDSSHRRQPNSSTTQSNVSSFFHRENFVGPDCGCPEKFYLACAFCDHPRQVLDRDRLLDMVQGREAHLFDRAVDNQISRLRRKIEADSRDPRFIQTVRGGGYRFATDVARLRRADEG